MGAKVSILAAKNKKRIANSLHHSHKSKTYNMDSNDTLPQQQKKYNTTGASPSPSALDEKAVESSVSSVTDSSMFASGRTFHHVANSAYWFPNDDEEMDRLIGVSSDSFLLV